MTLTGPSCSGKSHLRDALCKRFPEVFAKAVSCTTRPPREGEKDGEDYHFLGEAEATALHNRQYLEDDNIFVEHEWYMGYKYGIRYQDLNRTINSGKTPIAILTPQGVERAMGKLGTTNVLSIYLNTDLDLLVARYLKRFKEEVELKAGLTSGVDLVYNAGKMTKLVYEYQTWFEENEYMWGLVIDQYMESSSTVKENSVVEWFVKEVNSKKRY